MTSVPYAFEADIAPAKAAALVSLIQRLSFARDRAGVLEEVRTSARDLVGADGLAFVLRDGDCCFYAEEDSRYEPLGFKGARLPMTHCISGWVMRHGREAVIEDVLSDDPRLSMTSDAYRASFVKSMAMVPVREEDPVAAIGVYWGSHHRAEPGEMAMLRAVAYAAALALSNADLYGDLTAALAQAEQRAAEAARADLAKSRFLAAASHDLRQPLQALSLLTAVLEQGAGPRQRSVIDRMQHVLTGMADLLNSLLDLSKLEAGLVVPEPEPVDLPALFATILERFEPDAAAKGLDLRAVSCGLRPASDRVLLASMVGNLVGNAIRFTERGGVRLGCRRRGARLLLQVWDSGIGIAPEHLAQVFEEFYQIGNSERDRAQGLGLGLSIVQRTAALLGHEVSVVSRPGHGSVFTISLPLAP